MVEGVAHVLVDGYRGVITYAGVTFIPLWFLAAYAWVILLVPVTARAPARAPLATIVGLGAAVVLVDAARFGLDLKPIGWVNTALVWVFVHQSATSTGTGA